MMKSCTSLMSGLVVGIVLLMAMAVPWVSAIDICGKLPVEGDDSSEWVAAARYQSYQLWISHTHYYMIQVNTEPCSLTLQSSGSVPAQYVPSAIFGLGLSPSDSGPMFAMAPVTPGNVIYHMHIKSNGQWEVLHSATLNVPTSTVWKYVDYVGTPDSPGWLLFFSARYVLSLNVDVTQSQYKVAQLVDLDAVAPAQQGVSSNPVVLGGGFVHVQGNMVFAVRGGPDSYAPAQTVVLSYVGDGQMDTHKPIVTYLESSPQVFTFVGTSEVSSLLLWAQSYRSMATADVMLWDVSVKAMDSLDVKFDSSQDEEWSTAFVVDPDQPNDMLFVSGTASGFRMHDVQLVAPVSEGQPNMLEMGGEMAVPNMRIPVVGLNSDGDSFAYATVGSGTASSNVILLVHISSDESADGRSSTNRKQSRRLKVLNAPTFPPCGTTNPNSCPGDGTCCEISNTYRCMNICPYSS